MKENWKRMPRWNTELFRTPRGWFMLTVFGLLVGASIGMAFTEHRCNRALQAMEQQCHEYYRAQLAVNYTAINESIEGVFK